MTDEQDVAPGGEATEDAVREDDASQSEATENTEGQDDETQPAEGDEKPEDDKSPSKQRRDRRKAEMERLRQSEAEARKQAERLQERLNRIEQAAQRQQPPKEGDFQDYAEYQAALAAFKSIQALDARQRQELEEEAKGYQSQIDGYRQQERQAVAEAWAAQVDDARSRYADFDKVAFYAPINQQMAEIIATSDQGADVAYWLGQHRREAAAIAQMRPLDMARALGAIEARLSLPRPKATTETPDPIEPVKPRATARKDPAKMTMAEYKAWRAGKP